MEVNPQCTTETSTPCRLVERLAGRAAGVGAIPETGPIECPCHRAFRQSHYLRFARLELGLGREDDVRFEELAEQTRWPRPRTCQLKQARVAEAREFLAFRSERRAVDGAPARERQRLSRDDKLELFKTWCREDAT